MRGVKATPALSPFLLRCGVGAMGTTGTAAADTSAGAKSVTNFESFWWRLLVAAPRFGAGSAACSSVIARAKCRWSAAGGAASSSSSPAFITRSTRALDSRPEPVLMHSAVSITEFSSSSVLRFAVLCVERRALDRVRYAFCAVKRLTSAGVGGMILLKMQTAETVS